MDTFLLHAVADELIDSLVGARLVRVHRLDVRELVLTFRAPGETRYLLISLDPSLPRLHLCSAKGRAKSQGNFSTLLKNRLVNATLDLLEQEGMERVISMRFSRRDELGRLSRFILVAEMIPRAPNLFLIGEDGCVIDTFTRSSPSSGGAGRTEAGLPYVPPPKPPKADPLSAGREEVEAIFSAPPLEAPISALLVKKFFGLSPLMAKEIERRAEKKSSPSEPGPAEIWEGLDALIGHYRGTGLSPTVYLEEDGETPVAVSPFPLVQFEGRKELHFQSLSQALEYYYSRRVETQGKKRNTVELESVCSRLLGKLSTRRQALLSDIEESEGSEDYRRWGDLILANLRRIEKGMNGVTLDALYAEPSGKVRVELDPSLDASANAQRCFKRYSKLKKKGEMARRRLRETERRVAELEEVRSALKSGADPREIRERLVELGYLMEESEGDISRPKDGPVTGGIIRHTTHDGWEILVGKNSRANDYLTTRVAGRNDLWLHVRDYPGAHVVVRNPSGKAEIPPPVIEKAALLAALNSRTRGALRATVNYAFRKHVRKPKGAPPGTVTVKSPKSITVSLEEEDVLSGKRRGGKG